VATTHSQAENESRQGRLSLVEFAVGLGGTQTALAGGSVALIDNGTGKSRVFSGTPTTLPFTFTSPPTDQGTLFNSFRPGDENVSGPVENAHSSSWKEAAEVRRC
jgi:hypothetical protein